MPYGPPPQIRSKESRKEEPPAKRVRITVDLTQAEYQLLNRWLAGASVKLDQPLNKMTLARGIRARIQATAADQAAGDAVLDILGTEQS
jgi:hypothetical protein